jgi:hypothetical protein
MKRALILLLFLAACAGDAKPDLTLAPRKLDPALCTHPQAPPKLPDTASLPGAKTADEADGLAAFLAWVSDVRMWGKGLADRAEKTANDPVCK